MAFNEVRAKQRSDAFARSISAGVMQQGDHSDFERFEEFKSWIELILAEAHFKGQLVGYNEGVVDAHRVETLYEVN